VIPDSPLSPPLHLPLRLHGTLAPLAKVAASAEGHLPTRPMAGWATVWAQIMPDGRLVPVIDRDDQTMDCAAELAGIDWSSYLARGRGFWNDSHKGGVPGNRAIKVGIGRILQFHDADSPFAQEHGKVGWWTAGHLWDRDDPASWQLYTDYIPTSADLDRADAFWNVSQRLDGLNRPLGFSVDGRMRTSPCGRRIIWARVEEIAVAIGPSNPACTVEPVLAKSIGDDGLAFLRPGLIGRDETPAACGACSCGPNACGLRRLAKSMAADVAPLAPESRAGVAVPQTVPPDGAAGPSSLSSADGPTSVVRRLMRRLRNRYGLTEPRAIRALQHFLARRGLAPHGEPMADRTTEELVSELEGLVKGGHEDPATTEALAGLEEALKKADEDYAADQELAKEDGEPAGEGGEGGEGSEPEMGKAAPDEDEPTDDDDSEEGEETTDDDSSQGEKEPNDEGAEPDDDDMSKGDEELMEGFVQLAGMLNGIPALIKSFEDHTAAVSTAIDSIRGDVAELKKSVGTRFGRLDKLAKKVDRIDATSTALAKATVQQLKLVAESVELAKSRTAPAVSVIPDANPNAAALRAGLQPGAGDHELRSKALTKAVADQRLPPTAINYRDSVLAGRPVPPDIEAGIQASLPSLPSLS
jgi:hypothetical protein